MEAAALGFLARHLAARLLPARPVIVGPESGRARGSTSSSRAGSRQRRRRRRAAGPGECFPLGALIGRRATVYTYRAERTASAGSCRRSASGSCSSAARASATFSTEHLAQLVERSHRGAARRGRGSGARRRRHAGAAEKRLAASRRSSAAEGAVGEAVKRMHAERVGSIVVVDGAYPVGHLHHASTCSSGWPLRSRARGPHSRAHDAAAGDLGGGGDAGRCGAARWRATVPPRRGDARRPARRRGVGARSVRAAARRACAAPRSASAPRSRLEQLVEAAHDIRSARAPAAGAGRRRRDRSPR